MTSLTIEATEESHKITEPYAQIPTYHTTSAHTLSIIRHRITEPYAALHISYLHEPNNNKPTLVFDLFEEFRQFVIDRTIVVLFRRNEPLFTDKQGMLTQKSRNRIAMNVQERLNAYTIWRGKRWKCEDIIFHQARLIMHYLNLNGEKKYRPFIGRY